MILVSCRAFGSPAREPETSGGAVDDAASQGLDPTTVDGPVTVDQESAPSIHDLQGVGRGAGSRS